MGKHDKAYIGLISKDGHILIRSYDHKTKCWYESVLYQIPIEVGGGDDHNSPSILIRSSDKRVMVFWTGHGDATVYYRISQKPEDITSFGPIKSLQNPIGAYTYTQPVELKNEHKIYLFTRRTHESVKNICVWDINVSSDNGNTFVRNSNPLWFQEDIWSPYTEVCSNNIDTIWFVRSDTKIGDTFGRQNLMVCYYRNGAFFKTNGTKICEWNELPIKSSKVLDLIYDSNYAQNEDCYAKDIIINKKGIPSIVFTTMNDNGINKFWYGRLHNNRWKYTFITEAGGDITDESIIPNYDGGISLDDQNDFVVYLSKEINKKSKQFEIQKWVSTAQGNTWAKEQDITSFSDGRQIRPYCPKQHHPELPVLWLSGTHYKMHREYETFLYGRFEQ